MAIITAQAKLYTGIRCWCVDKNISAALTSSFSVGNKDIDFPTDVPVLDANGRDTIYPNVYIWRLRRAVADLRALPGIALTDERYKTYGGGNNVITAGPVVDNTNNWKVNAAVSCTFPTYIQIDVEKLGIPEGTDCILNFEEGWLLEDKGRKLPSGNYEYPNAVQSSPSPEQLNYVQFRTPWYGVGKFTSSFSFPVGNFRLRRTNSDIGALFSPNFVAKANKVGIIEMDSLSSLYFVPGRKRYFASQMYGVFGPIGPGSVAWLEGNGYPYDTGLGQWYNGFPGIQRIRQFNLDSNVTTTLSADVYNLPWIWTYETLNSNFTMSATGDAYKGVGTPHLVSETSLSCTNKVDYNITVPTMQSNATVFCRTPVQAEADLVVSSSMVTQSGAPLTLTWFAIDPGLTTGIVFKGPNIDVTIKWSTGHIDYVSGGTSNPDIADAPITKYYSRTHTAVDYITAEIYGSLSGFQFSKNGVDRTNGDINGDSNSNTLFAGTWYVPGRQRLVSCSNWGDVGLTNLNGAFANCLNLTTVPSFLPNTATGELSMSCAFMWCAYLDHSNLTNWNTSDVGNMSGMFRNALRMRQNIGNWNTSNVTNMTRMFDMNGHSSGTYGYAISFPNTNTLNWDVTNVSRTNMTNMFAYHQGANLNLSSWCVSHITTMPTNFTFQSTTNWPTARRPQWGTCP